ncbi:CDC48 like AAA ATPase [Cryptosporidium felis]|nr:CDC48 like AAA ATPase [Cryptosporidium felis]
MKNKQKNRDPVIDNLEGRELTKDVQNNSSMIKWPHLLGVVQSKDISRSNLLEIRVSENTLNKIGLANGTQCVVSYNEKSVCVITRSLEQNIKFNDFQGLLGELVLNNLDISDAVSKQVEIMPLRSFIKEKSILYEVSKHATLKFLGYIDLDHLVNNCYNNLIKTPPEHIKTNNNVRQLLISRTRGVCVFEGNMISIQIASMIFYFKVFEFTRNGEFNENFTKIVKIGNQTKVELFFENEPIIYMLKTKLKDNFPTNKKYGFDKIGGMNHLKNEINKSVINPLKFSSLYKSFGIKPSKGILLYGPPGTGKTLFARCIAEEIELIELGKKEGSEIKTMVDFIVIDGSNINSNNNDEEDHFFKSIQRVKDNSRKEQNLFSIIFIDEIDMICGSRDSFTGIDNRNKKYLTTILSLLDGFDENNKVILIATTNKPNEIDPALRRAGRIDRELEVGVPNNLEREEILKLILSEIPNDLDDSEINQIVNETQAFVGADLKMLISESINTYLGRITQIELKDGDEKPLLSFKDIQTNIQTIKPSALRELAIEIPKTYWEDIGGYESVKEQLKECVEWPLIHSDLFEYMKIKPPSGVLLYGPPGCSKTLMAKAVATESKMNFISVKGPELFSKWVGESEKSIREIFRKARQNSPCVIFFDEIDAIGVNRETHSSTSDVSTRVLSQMLNEMDGITSNKQVIVIGATNRPDLLDSALLRPGRLDRIIYIGLPDPEARKKILNIYLDQKYFKFTHESNFIEKGNSISSPNHKLVDKLGSEIDILCNCIEKINIFTNYEEMMDLLVNLTNGYSGAELALLCRETMMQVIRKTISNETKYIINNDASSIKESIRNITFTWDDITFALNKVKPRIPQTLIKFYEDYNKSSNI